MPNLNDYHGYKSISGSSDNGGDSRGGGQVVGFGLLLGLSSFSLLLVAQAGKQ